MVVDKLENLKHYVGINPRVSDVIDFIGRDDLTALDPGKYPIDEENIFAVVSRNMGRSVDAARLEAHEKYLDIQVVLGGVDNIGWKDVSSCVEVSEPYDATRDVKFFDDKPVSWLPVRSGWFAIFEPNDAHMPAIADHELTKIVVKVLVD